MWPAHSTEKHVCLPSMWAECTCQTGMYRPEAMVPCSMAGVRAWHATWMHMVLYWCGWMWLAGGTGICYLLGHLQTSCGWMTVYCISQPHCAFCHTVSYAQDGTLVCSGGSMHCTEDSRVARSQWPCPHSHMRRRPLSQPAGQAVRWKLGTVAVRMACATNLDWRSWSWWCLHPCLILISSPVPQSWMGIMFPADSWCSWMCTGHTQAMIVEWNGTCIKARSTISHIFHPLAGNSLNMSSEHYKA